MADPSNEVLDSLRVVLYTKPGCHLCDELLAELRELQHSLDFEIELCDIEQDSEAWERFRYLVPVLEVPGGELLHPPHERVVIRDSIDAGLRWLKVEHD